VLARLRAIPWLPGGIVPAAARVLAVGIEGAVPLLRAVIPGLLPEEWAGRAGQRSLQALGVRRLPVSDVVDAVAGIQRPPDWWQRLYTALADAPDREALGALPVPLADGRLVTGPRGVLLPGADLAGLELSPLDIRMVHPAAVHPLLERLGGVPATAHSVLADERVRAQVEQALDGAPEEEAKSEPGAAPRLADAVLALVSATGIRPGEHPWLADLPLPGDDGEIYPAGELLLPGSALAAVMAVDAPFGTAAPALVERWGADVLEATGVLAGFGVLRALDVDLAEHDLDAEHDYLAAVLPDQGSMLEELVAVRDLEFVDPSAWPAALRLLGSEGLRQVVAGDAVIVPSGATVPSYTRWWLARHRVLDGSRPRDVRLAEATDLCGLYDQAAGADDDLLRLLGCRSGLADVLADVDGALDLLDRLADPARSCPPGTLRTAYARLAEVLVDVDPPDRVRVEQDLVVPAGNAVVMDAPYALPLLAERHPVPGGEAVADLLDLPLASELAQGVPEGSVAREVAWKDVPGAALAAERLDAVLPDAPVTVHS
ncbi:MAG: ATP-binding protein, partial [Mycobacteriales bacterium]